MTDRTSIELDAEAAHEATRRINHTTILTGDGFPRRSSIGCSAFCRARAATPRPGSGSDRPRTRAIAVHPRLYEDDARDPADSVAHAVNALRDASDLLQRIGPFHEAAQAAISRQGYRTYVVDEDEGVRA